MFVEKCKPRLNVCLEQQNSRTVGCVQNGLKLVIKIHKTFMKVTHLNTRQYQPRSQIPVTIIKPLSHLDTSLYMREVQVLTFSILNKEQ